MTKEYYEKNKELILEKSRLYREANKERIKSQQKEYRELTKDDRKEINKEHKKKYKDKNREMINEQSRIYYNINKEKVLERTKRYRRNKRQENPLFKLSCNIRNRIAESIRAGGYTKRSKTNDILSCSFDEFKTHIESLWEPWMTWDNYGLYNGTENYGWDIDHIIPVSSAINEEGVIALNHYTNLQPLCSFINRTIKKDNIR